jgi:hypothetical protein
MKSSQRRESNTNSAKGVAAASSKVSIGSSNAVIQYESESMNAPTTIIGGGGGNVQVVCRFRPLNDREKNASG